MQSLSTKLHAEHDASFFDVVDSKCSHADAHSNRA